MSKKTPILLYVAIWTVLFLSPLTYFNRGNSFIPMQYLMLCVSPLLLMTVFYINYLWLAPHYYMKGRKQLFWGVNIVMIISLGIALHYWMAFTHDLFENNGIPRERMLLQRLLFILRNTFNLSVAATVATAMRLAARWQHAEEARLIAEAAQAEAELKNLRSQTNPHFLLNTLNNIYALAAIDSGRAQEAIQQLSHLLRHALYDYQQPSVPLAEEVEFLENYVKLMKIRLSPNVDVQFETHYLKSDTAAFEDVSLGKNIQIAPLIFISLVENAFKHGVSPTEPSFIHITILADNQQICCDIENSNHPKTSEGNSGHGIGLSQVQRRLDLAYPERYTWTKGVSENGQTYRSVITIASSTAN
jgi:sensor histidine kinase YesM